MKNKQKKVYYKDCKQVIAHMPTTLFNQMMVKVYTIRINHKKYTQMAFINEAVQDKLNKVS